MSARDDAARDGLALIDCAHRSDWEGAQAIFANCDTRMVAGFLARLAVDLIEELADWLTMEPADMVSHLRREKLGGG